MTSSTELSIRLTSCCGLIASYVLDLEPEGENQIV